MTEIYIDTIAYMEKNLSWAQPLATFADDKLYSLCAPIIEEYIANYCDGRGQRNGYILTESCDLGITIPDVMEFQREEEE